jgi:hypothetical protein
MIPSQIDAPAPRRIRKVGAVILRHGLLLVVRKRGTNRFISPGGKPEPGETAIQCLERELAEELQIRVVSHQSLGTFSDQSAFENTQVDMKVHRVWTAGVPSPGQEIEELAWVDAGYRERGLAMGSIFDRFVLPRLIEQGLVRATRRTSPPAERSLLVADLDGTLVFDGKPLARPLKEALHTLRERNELVFATSRAPRGAAALLGDLLSAGSVICCNGAIVLERGRVTRRQVVGSDVVVALCGLMDELGAEFYLEYGERFALCAGEASFREMRNYKDCASLDRTRRDWAEGVVKIAVRARDKQAFVRECLRRFDSQVHLAVHESEIIDIGPAGVNKLTALQQCFDLARTRLTALGNDENDFELLAEADAGYVVGHRLAGLEWAGGVKRVPASLEHLLELLQGL